MNVVICDDNQNLLTLLSLLLKRSGYRVKTLDNLDELEPVIENEQPVVAIIDYHFQQQTSHNIIARLRRRFSNTIFILISSAENIAYIARDLRLHYYFKKPFKFNALLTKVNDIREREYQTYSSC